jgi:hypothetical protein
VEKVAASASGIALLALWRSFITAPAPRGACNRLRDMLDFFQPLHNLGLHVNQSSANFVLNVDRAYAKRGFMATWAAQGRLI